MGDHSKSAVYSELLEYFEQHGVSLGENGVSYMALSQAAAVGFLALLRRHSVQPLGFDIWRHTIHGYSMDSLAGWASGSPAPAAHQEALAALASTDLGPRDVVSFQY
jgi:hypothetical protein